MLDPNHDIIVSLNTQTTQNENEDNNMEGGTQETSLHMYLLRALLLIIVERRYVEFEVTCFWFEDWTR